MTETDRVLCFECSIPMEPTNLVRVMGGSVVCPDCALNSYTACSDCGRLFRNGSRAIQGFVTVDSGNRVCDDCRLDHYTFCHPCGEWIDNDDDHYHDDEDDVCYCAVNGAQFRVRNGDGYLDSDMRVPQAVPARVTDTGVRRIKALLKSTNNLDASRFAEFRMASIGTEWMTVDGTYPTRIKRAAYSSYGYKIPNYLMAEIGNIARDDSTPAQLPVDVTRDLNAPASNFANAGSCWWGEYGYSRCAFKTNGGFALRAYDQYGDVAGRAWVLPLKLVDGSLTPTFNTEDPAAFVLFNGYGSLPLSLAARLLGRMTGRAHKHIDFTGDPMYVNGESGWLVASEAVLADVGELHLILDEHANLYRQENTNVQISA